MRCRTRRILAPALALVTIVAAGCGASGHGPRSGPAPPRPFFSPSSVWNTPLADSAALDPRSPALIGWLESQINREFQSGPAPYIQTVTDSTPVYRVGKAQPPVHVTLDNSAPWAQSFAQAIRSVPIPPNAQPALGGGDDHLTIWQPATDRLWEFWKARKAPDGWHAEWGGAMQHVSTSPGYYTTYSWPGARPYWGATATSLPMVAGTMMLSELKAGRIDHALAIALPQTRAGEFTWPAQRTDGTDTDPNSIPEGAHLRLDPKLDIASLHLPPVIEAMAVAAQRYGLIVRDKTLSSTALFAETPTAGRDPYAQIFGGVPSYDLLKAFPWEHLQVLRMRLRLGTGSPS